MRMARRSSERISSRVYFGELPKYVYRPDIFSPISVPGAGVEREIIEKIVKIVMSEY